MSRLNISIAVIVLTAALSAVDMPLQGVAVETAVDTVGVTARISAAAATTVVGISAAAISGVGAISSDRRASTHLGDQVLTGISLSAPLGKKSRSIAPAGL